MLPFLDASAVDRLLSPADAVEMLRGALLGVSEVTAPPRASIPTQGGHILLMPACDGRFFGLKVAGVAPDNPTAGLPRITGTYQLFDAKTHLPQAVIDGPALTLLRTAALSALAVDVLAPPAVDHMLIFGTGPQAAAHLEAIIAVRNPGRITVAGRTPESSAAFARAHGVEPGAPEGVATADLVVCCTSAIAPLFDGRLLRPSGVVVAMGSHTADARELDAEVLRGASIVVEEEATARREAADVAEALDAGVVRELVPLSQCVRAARPVDQDVRRVFRSVGMAWEDLAVASAILGRFRAAQ